MDHIAIIGNGIAGITAARNIRKLDQDCRITVISSESKYFYSRTALMYIFMGHMKFEHTKPYEDWFWEKNNINLKMAHVDHIEFDQKKLKFSDGSDLKYDKLIIATGSKSNKFGWPGQDLEGVQGLYSLQDLELLEKNCVGVKHAVIVGGGLIGVELAEMLHSRGIEVTFLIRETGFWQNVLPQVEADLIGRHIEKHGVRLILNTALKEITSNDGKKVDAVITEEGEKIDCELVGLTVGVSPNIDFLNDTDLEIGRGIKVNEYLETNIPDVYAIGDCTEIVDPLPGRRAIEPVWYTGRMMGETVAGSIVNSRTRYQPGVWFNSAKFFDVEYQTYGVVPNQVEQGTKHFYWEDAAGERSFRLVYDQASKKVLGMNSFGMRWRHQVFNDWLVEEVTVHRVLEELHKANFDPEFFKIYKSAIIGHYNSVNPDDQIKTDLANRRKLLNLFSL